MGGVVEHRTVSVNGIKLHYAEKGEGPVILFLHGFPELWYSWRHQIAALADKGYRCIAPDLRGFGDSDHPTSSFCYTVLHIVGDLVGLLDALSLEQVFVVGHDWGAFVAWYLAVFRPERVKALISLSVSYKPFTPEGNPLQVFRAVYGDDYYMLRFQKPGEAEAEFATVEAATIIKFFFSLKDPRPIFLPKGIFTDWAQKDSALPPWLSQDDIDHYASKFEKTGFTGGVNYYRAINLDMELLAPWQGAKVKVPTKFIIGDHDVTYSMPGAQEYIHGEEFKKDVPLLELVIMEGAGHWINQERADEITALIYDFFSKF